MGKQASLNLEQKSFAFSPVLRRRLREGGFILMVGCAAFFLVALLTYSSSDPGFLHTGLRHSIHNAGGPVGAWLADVFLFFFGGVAYLFPVLMVYSAWLLLREGCLPDFDMEMFIIRAVGMLLLIITACGLASLRGNDGGILGVSVVKTCIAAFNGWGSLLLLLMLFLAGLTFTTGCSWLRISEMLGKAIVTVSKFLQYAMLRQYQQLKRLLQRTASDHGVSEYEFEPVQPKVQRQKPVTMPAPEIDPLEVAQPIITQPAKPVKKKVRGSKRRGALPSLQLLDPPEQNMEQGFSDEQLEFMSREVEQRLLDFGVDVKVVAVHPGPVITRFEMQLAPGVKVSKITALAKDLARSLSVTSVRIVEVIAGKSVVGLELPNEHREMVRLSEVLSAPQYEQARSPLSMALGKDIAGHPVVVDLAKMPHLLVAGTTGSGKSVGLNAMLLSLLYKASPREVRMILVDPKMLELSVYNDIPHLLCPVVTDMRDAQQALRWCVVEMERRYRLMSMFGVRNVAGFNKKIAESEAAGHPLIDPLTQTDESGEPNYLETLPAIVVVIDELADMMMVVGKKVEQLIARIAQKARAAGIHMILATQRPSVDVLTGLIKSNIPTRMAFQVSSKIDSRTILDQQGAEQLLGHGDMLYLPPGNAVPVRVHGAFVDDHEVHNVTADWKERAEPDYLTDVLEGPSAGEAQDLAIPGLADGSDTEDTDPLYDQVVEFITSSRKASISSVQRRFKIGYNRAARLIEELERTGVVTPMESNGSREVLAPPPTE